MPDEMDLMVAYQTPTADRPLLGLTVLVVEDSRFASEAMRLLCLRSGARIRRADSLRSARRHLSVYRPAVVIVDLGLPDGSGLELIGELARARPRVGVLLAISGDPAAAAAAQNAGADDFLEKPIDSLGAFQHVVMKHLPPDGRPRGLRPVSDEVVHPDPMALQDDLAHISEVLTTSADDDETVAYAAQFIGGLARIAGDSGLAEAAGTLEAHRREGRPVASDLARIAGLVQERLVGRKVV